MSHNLAFFTDGRARMAYVGEKPWHSLGQQLTANAPLSTWATESGMDFEIHEAPVTFTTQDGKTYEQGTKKVLYRADNHEPLGVVGKRYKVVQPLTILDFFSNLVADQGFQLETAGVMFNGSKYWAMARTGQEAQLAGGDVVRQYLMLATACDGSLRTTGKFVMTRVVCDNTITMALGESNPAGTVKVSHSSDFHAGKMQADLGLVSDSWAQYIADVKQMSQAQVTNEQAIRYVATLFGDINKPAEDNMSIPAVSKVLSLYGGYGKGSELESAEGTAWGLVNAVTEYVDWHIGKNQDRRLESAWMYGGSTLKMDAFQMAKDLISA